MNTIEKIEKKIQIGYFSVYSKNGIKICDTSTIEDAKMMVSFDHTRFFKENKFLEDHIVNISYKKLEDDLQLKEQMILPDRQQDPFIV